MTAFTDETIDRLLAVCRAATPGPVKRFRSTGLDGKAHPMTAIQTNSDEAQGVGMFEKMEDADFDRAARDPDTGYAAALTELREARALLRDMLNEGHIYGADYRLRVGDFLEAETRPEAAL